MRPDDLAPSRRPGKPEIGTARSGRNAPETDFLRRRFAAAIERGDDRTASRLAILLDRALNGWESSP